MKRFFLRYSIASLLLIILVGIWDYIPRFSRGENISKDLGFDLPTYTVDYDGGTGHGTRWLTITLDTPLPKHTSDHIRNDRNGWEKVNAATYSLKMKKGTESMYCTINLDKSVLEITYEYEDAHDFDGVWTALFAMFLILIGITTFIVMVAIKAIKKLKEKSRLNQ